MSADGEVEVQVKAEGVDEASEELAGEGGGVGGAGGGGGGQQGGLRGSLKSGIVAGLVTAVAGPLLEPLSALLDVVKAFLAPVAALALRLLSPFLRFMLTKVLPPWLNFLEVGTNSLSTIKTVLSLILGVLPMLAFLIISGIADWLGIDLATLADDIIALPGNIWSFVSGGFSDLSDDITSLPGEIWSRVQQLSGMIGRELANRLPNVDPVGSVTGNGENNGGLVGRGQRFVENNTPEVNVSGSMGAFVEAAENESGIDLP